jgi:hypothetical protein
VYFESRFAMEISFVSSALTLSIHRFTESQTSGVRMWLNPSQAKTRRSTNFSMLAPVLISLNLTSLKSLTMRRARLSIVIRVNAYRYGVSPNKSLDASGGSVIRIMIGPAMLE